MGREKNTDIFQDLEIYPSAKYVQGKGWRATIHTLLQITLSEQKTFSYSKCD